MILRKEKWFLHTIFTILLVGYARSQGERTYDTSEWIPITPTSLEASASENVEDKIASDRVLSIDAPAQRFFPNDDYEYRKQKPNQVQQFLRESPSKKGFEQPRPRKLKYPVEYKFEAPPPPPAKVQHQLKYFNGENLPPYSVEKPRHIAKAVRPPQQNYYVPLRQTPNRPVVDSYVAIPSVNPQAPAPNAPNHYEQYQLPFNSSFYQSLSPSLINNDFYQAINNNTQESPINIPLASIKSKLPTINNLASTPKPSIEQESVQLVYVPVENLRPNQPATQDSRTIYQQVDAPKQPENNLNHQQVNQAPLTFNGFNQQRAEKLIYNPPTLSETPTYLYSPENAPRQEKLVALPQPVDTKQARLESIQQDFIQQALQAHKLQEQLTDEINPVKQEVFATTGKPKQKPHQPPLAVFLESNKKAEITDVLNILRTAKTISVQDTVTSDSPEIFIGPSNLESPHGYTKFPLPYLNNINGNRIERKIDQLPFFVAPVSYKTPPGYSKISLPSPHVGSVVVSIPFSSSTPDPTLFNQNQLNPFGFSSAGYSSLNSPEQQQNIFENYNIPVSNQGQYKSTPATQEIESPGIPPVRNIFENTYATRQPDAYYSPQQISNQQSYVDSGITINPLRSHDQEEQKYPTREQTYQSPSSTVRPKQNSHEQPELPDVSPLELAINEFELHQINDQLKEQHHKVKHSTTRRPQTVYDDEQTISTTRSPSRQRPSYQNEQTSERPVSRGRTRGRVRGGTTRGTTTTSRTTIPSQTDRYTVLEEFVAKEPARGPSTENYRINSAEPETEPPRRSTTPFSGNPYLPKENFDTRLPVSGYEDVQLPPFENSNSDIRFETPEKPPNDLKESRKQSVSSANTQSLQQTNDFSSGNTQIENIPANVYSLGQPQTYEILNYDQKKNSETPTGLSYDNFEKTKEPERPTQAEPAATYNHRFSPEVISYENREPNQRRPQQNPNYQEYDVNNNGEPDIQQVIQTETYDRIPGNEKEKPLSKPQFDESPTGFLENLLKSNFDQTYISLQDQAVRSLLVPNLLAPTTKKDSILTKNTVSSITESFVEEPSSTPAETTTTPRTRTRGRTRGRPTNSPTATNAPRRTASRRRPATRTSTERISSTTEHFSREDSARLGSNTNQRFRTRGKPILNENIDRVSTTEHNANAFKEPNLENGFEALKNQEPISYMKFEHDVNEQDIITINPNYNNEQEIKEYHQVYSLQKNTENPQKFLEYDNTKVQATPIVDVQVVHSTPESEVLIKPTEEESFVRYSNANIKSGGVLNNKKIESTTRASNVRVRGRTKGRSRFATTTTSRPVTRISTKSENTPIRTTTTSKEENESYGFTRQPNYTPTNLNIQAKPTSNKEPSIQFVGEIRPKYSSRTTQPATDEVDIAETPRPKIRSRTRTPIRKTSSTYRQSYNDDDGTEKVTRRSGVTAKTRSRGSSHYRGTENVKRASDDDVANQNYPANFLQKLESSSPKPTSAAFQITIDPLDEETDDQSPYSSLYRPKFAPKPYGWADANSISSSDKVVSFQDKESNVINEPTINNDTEPQALAFIHTTENSEIPMDSTESEVERVMAELEKIETLPTEESVTFRNPTEQSVAVTKGKRRGVWKLVKQRPVDPLEVSESQNYQTVLNAFDSIKKVDPYTKSYSGGEKPIEEKDLSNGLLNFNRFQQEIDNFNFDDNSYDVVQKSTEASITDTVNTEPITKSTIGDDIVTTIPLSTTETHENIFDTIYEMFGVFNTAENKQSENQNISIPTTTIMSPTFPEEITEIPTTTTEKIIQTTQISDENIKTNEQYNTDDNIETTESILPTTTKSSTRSYEVEPWEMKVIKTSTSTEVSHETEICYKGRCVKSRQKKHK